MATFHDTQLQSMPQKPNSEVVNDNKLKISSFEVILTWIQNIWVTI